MAEYNRELELEDGVLIEYTIEASKFMPATMTDPAEGGIEGCHYQIIITSDSIVDHMSILSELAINYTESDIEKLCIEAFENEVPDGEC